jgi:hypothetical protein
MLARPAASQRREKPRRFNGLLDSNVFRTAYPANIEA